MYLEGERLTLRIRRDTFAAILRQEMGWFDLKANSTGALCARLSSDSSKIQGATGSRMGTLAQVWSLATPFQCIETRNWPGFCTWIREKLCKGEKNISASSDHTFSCSGAFYFAHSRGDGDLLLLEDGSGGIAFHPRPFGGHHPPAENHHRRGLNRESCIRKVCSGLAIFMTYLSGFLVKTLVGDQGNPVTFCSFQSGSSLAFPCSRNTRTPWDTKTLSVV